jgi:hypothetical protein
MKNKILLPLIVIVALLSTSFVQADEGEEVLGYDEIVSQLSRSKTSASDVSSGGDPFKDVMFHFNIGINSTLMALSPETGDQRSSLQGMEIGFGIDLFNPEWVAEGAFASYSEDNFEGARASLKEFSLRLTYRPFLARSIQARVGMGLAARYLNYKPAAEGSNDEIEAAAASNNVGEAQEYSTPASLFILGAQYNISKLLSLGTEINYRSTMVSDTIDRSAVTAGIRLDVNF